MLQPMQHAMGKWEIMIQQDPHTRGSLCVDLVPRWAALCMFVEVGGIEPTNNAAERPVRPAMLWRTGWYGTQSNGGSRVVARVLTVSAPCRQHTQPLRPSLIGAMTASWAYQPAPKLVPSG